MNATRTLAGATLALLLSSPAFAAGEKPAVFDPAHFDTTCSPCRDFDQYASGGWKRTAVIPAANPTWGSFAQLAENNQLALSAILESAARDKSAKPGSPTAMIGAYYSACMDSAAAERAGLAPLQPLLTGIAGMKSNADLASQAAWLHSHGVRGVLFNFGAGPDIKNSVRNIANTGQGGISLPDRDYYLKTDSTSVALLALALRARARGGDQTALCASMNNVQRRDPNTYPSVAAAYAPASAGAYLSAGRARARLVTWDSRTSSAGSTGSSPRRRWPTGSRTCDSRCSRTPRPR
jgi:hypothetical protein